jgi:hypothetical protein
VKVTVLTIVSVKSPREISRYHPNADSITSMAMRAKHNPRIEVLRHGPVSALLALAALRPKRIHGYERKNE